MKGQIDLKIFEKNPDNFNFQIPVCHLSFQKLLEPTNFNFFDFETMNERMLTPLDETATFGVKTASNPS